MTKENKELKTVFSDLRENPYHRFNVAFALMSVIPLLAGFYLIMGKFFTIHIAVGHTGLVLLLAVFIALSGYYLGYLLIHKILNSVVFYALKAKKSYSKLQETQLQLIQSAKRVVVGELAGGVAHEVKNPLATISMCIKYLESEPDPGKEEREKKLKIMKEAVSRADKIVCSLLNFSGSDPLELEPCEINTVIRSSLDLVGRKIGIEHVKITEALDEHLPLVMIDENQMKQVFINTILNSLQAMPEGGELTVRTYTGEVTEPRNGVGTRTTDHFMRGDKGLICEIQDTGKGIPEDYAARVFDPFFTSKAIGEGPGLGLTIIGSIVERHRGLIDIESKEGQGTKVIITLPVPREQAG